MTRKSGSRIIYNMKDYKLNERYANVKMTIVIEGINNEMIYWRYLKNPYDDTSLSSLHVNTLFGLETTVQENIHYMLFDVEYLKEMVNYSYDEKIEIIKQNNRKSEQEEYNEYLTLRKFILRESQRVRYRDTPLVTGTSVAASTSSAGGKKRRGIGYDIISIAPIGL